MPTSTCGYATPYTQKDRMFTVRALHRMVERTPVVVKRKSP